MPSSADHIAGPPWRSALSEGLKRSLALSLFLLKWVLPLYVATEILVRTGALHWVSGFLEPVMGLFKLPPEAAVVITAGMLVNLYAAAAVAAPLNLSPEQITVLGLMLGIAHNLVLEGVIVRQLSDRYRLLTLLRIGLGLAAGLAVAWML